uniref:Uncharacterized protein n=1 Tax=Tanacetum cinerariifolium TaxID=118510 RepID=A0A6L2MIC4_TANCI|nr:hypothetical protein [Tanacetum cinerariifolium]
MTIYFMIKCSRIKKKSSSKIPKENSSQVAIQGEIIILDTYGDTVTLKRRRDNKDKDKEPSAGSNRGSNRRQTRKELESTSTLKEKTSKQLASQLKGPNLITSATDDQPFAEASQHHDWFQKQAKPPTPDRAWNKTLLATHGPIQTWISNLARKDDSRSLFNELMDTPLEFLAFMMNRLKVDTLTPKLLSSPTYELMKGSCNSLVELEFFLKEVYKATTDQLDWNNPEGISHWGRKRQQFYGFAVNRESARDVYFKRRIITVTELQIVEWHNY